MAELFMECEEEELEPWQQKSKPIVVDDDDDDDEPIFVGEILSSKPASTYILNRVNPSSPRTGLQNGAPKTGFQSTTRPAASTLAVQPQPRVSGVSGTAQALQRPPLSGCPSPQEAAKTSSGLSQTAGRAGTAPSLARNLGIPVLAQSAFRPVATVTAQPVTFNRGPTPGLAFGSRQNSGGSSCQSGSPVNTTGLSKRPSTSDVNSTSPKKVKADELGGPGSDSPVLLPNDTSLLQKGATSTSPFPQACPKCNIHFNLLEPLKNHIKYCCPEVLPAFLGGLQPDGSGGASAKLVEAEPGKLIMLVNDFYYGKYEGNLQQACQEQKTHTTFKCASCMKLLKSNIRFMNHMKHHLELEKQNSESWESHTTCQHCYRQFPTPFQLQCHIESTHTPHECSTICKICELSFETEQVLLQHMKDNHKPGEMPYVCQVCSYRSSAFSDVEKHFRTVHENTKNLLCPFCLKVIKVGAPYMHHFMRHQKKGVHRCTKCRLQFLTCKEKLDHKSQHHRTFKKPAQLEGLPPGTKVTIRASVGSLPPAAMAASPVNAHAFPLQTSPADKVPNAKSYHSKGSVSKAKSKAKPLSQQKKQSAGSSASTSSAGSGSSSGGGGKKHEKVANTALNSLRCPDIQKCIECNSDIRTFASHFPAYVCCGLCRYKTSCSKAYVNHMMSFHSARQKKRFWIYRTCSDGVRGMTVVCLDCDFLTDDSDLDQMAAHLNDNDTHTCHIIMESVPGSFNSLPAADISDQTHKALLANERDEKPQELARPASPEEQEGACMSQSSQIEAVVEAAQKEAVGEQRDGAAFLAESEENTRPAEEPPLPPPPLGGLPPPPLPPLPVCAVETPADSAEEEKPLALGVQGSEGAEAHEEPLPGIESLPGAGGAQGSPPGCVEGGRDHPHEAEEEECEGRKASLSMAGGPSLLEPGSPGEGEAGASQGEDPLSEAVCGGGTASSVVQPDPSSSSPGSPSCPEEPGRAAPEGSLGPPDEGQGLGSPVAGCEGKACLSVPGDASHAGGSGGGCSEETPEGPGQEGRPDSPGGAELAAPSLPVPERASPGRLSLASEEPGMEEAAPQEEEEEAIALPHRGSCLSPPPAGEEEKPSSSSPSVPEDFPTPLSSLGSVEAFGGVEGGGPESQGGQAGLAAPACGESASGSSPEAPLLSGASEAPPRSPLEGLAAPDPLGSPGGGGQGGGSPASAEGKEEEEEEQLPRGSAGSMEDGVATPGGPAGEKTTSSSGPGGQGEAGSCPDSAEEEEVKEEEEEVAQAGEAPSQEDTQEAEGEATDRCPEPGAESEASGFEQFLSMHGEASLANSEGSDQGSSAQLEPLTPSELLEHEATEILQGGGGGRASSSSSSSSSSSALGGSGAEESEHTEGAASREGSPGPGAASGGGGPTEEGEDDDPQARQQQQP